MGRGPLRQLSDRRLLINRGYVCMVGGMKIK